LIDLGLAGKRAVVSGAGYIQGRAGHGRACSLRLAAAGAAVACIDIDKVRADAIVAEIAAAGGTAFPVIADMTDQQQVERALAEAADLLGSIDVCVDIIGGPIWDKVEDADPDDWEWVIRANLTQVFYLFKQAGRHMIQQGTGGAMVTIASVDGTFASGYHASYGAAKAGVISLTKTFADELGKHGVRVNAVAPGNVGSGNEDQPEGQFAVNGINPLAAPRTRDIANAVLFLCSELSARITGQTLIVDGGVTIKSLWDITGDQLERFRQQQGPPRMSRPAAFG